MTLAYYPLRGLCYGGASGFMIHLPLQELIRLARCVASCTAHLEELTLPEDQIKNVGRCIIELMYQ